MDQSLPTSFDNSSSVASLMPMYFAQQVGQQNNIASTNNDALQKAFQMQQDQQSKMNPLLLLDKSAETQGRNATSAYYNSLATGKNIENTTNQAEQGPTIAAHNATSNATTAGQQYVQMANEAQKFGAVGGALKAWEDQGVPAPTQAEYAISHLGLDPNGPEAQVIRDQAGKGQLSTILSEHADHVYTQSTAAKAEAARLASAERIEAQKSETQKSVAQTAATSRQTVALATHNADLLIAKGMSSGNLDAQAGGYQMKSDAEVQAANQAEQEGNTQMAQSHRQLASYYSSQAANLKTQSAKNKAIAAGTVKPGAVSPAAATGLPAATNADPTVAPAMAPGGTGAPPGATPQPAASGPAPDANGMVTVKDPKGIVGKIPASQLQKALKLGYTQ